MTHPSTATTSFQAHRYARLGYGELFTNPSSLALSELMASCCACCQELVAVIAEVQPPDPIDRRDVERILQQLQRDFRDGVLLVVAPTSDQLAQIQEDGLRLHATRLELLLTVLEGMAVYGSPRSAARLRHTAALLRSGALVVIKTT